MKLTHLTIVLVACFSFLGLGCNTLNTAATPENIRYATFHAGKLVFSKMDAATRCHRLRYWFNGANAIRSFDCAHVPSLAEVQARIKQFVVVPAEYAELIQFVDSFWIDFISKWNRAKPNEWCLKFQGFANGISDVGGLCPIIGPLPDASPRDQ